MPLQTVPVSSQHIIGNLATLPAKIYTHTQVQVHCKYEQY